MSISRSSGILMPIFSLPEKYGVGTLGEQAYKFIDFLKASGQKYWQILPVGPLSYGDSPYQSFSTYAGNPYFVDLSMLVEDGLLAESDLDGIDWGDDPEHVDYGKLYSGRFTVLSIAAKRGVLRDAREFSAFVEENSQWLENYALFMACKRHFDMKCWMDWPDRAIRLHEEQACAEYREKLRDEVELFEYIQFLFFSQWKKLREYAGKQGVGIIGDLPIYVALDSADVWSEPKWFQLSSENVPTAVSGVPPDYFSENGQLWGNPLYRWDEMERDGFGWWIRRVDGAFKLYDVLRFDHFRGLESYWSVPYGEETAKNGQWINGPGMKFVNVLTSWFKDKEFIAEDLGLLTPGVRQLLKDSGFPGMKVLEFAFDSETPSDYLPHNHIANCVCYTGTHDNTTLMAWGEEMSEADKTYTKRYLGLSDEEGFNWGLIRAGMSSVSNLFVAQLQDYIGIGKIGRINEPGTLEGNWVWRMDKTALTPELAAKIKDVTVLYGRTERPVVKKADKEETEEKSN